MTQLIESCAQSLRGAVQEHTDKRVEVQWKAATVTPASEGTVWWEQPSADGRAALVFGVPPEAAAAIELEGEADADAGTTPELLSQTILRMLASVAEPLRSDIGLPALRRLSSPPSAGEAFEIAILFGAAALPAITVVVNPELAGRPASAAGLPPARRPRTAMDLLMEVELPVRVSFGRSRVPLKDVLKLTVGSVLELNRPLDSSVDVVVNNCFVARGELVVVEGNYAIRIQQINDGERRDASRHCA